MIKYFSDQVTEFFRVKEEESVFSAVCHPLVPDIPIISPCVKCGNTDISTSYHTGNHLGIGGCGHSPHNNCKGEHLHYYCRTCKYDWVGPTLDQKEEQDVRSINNL